MLLLNWFLIILSFSYLISANGENIFSSLINTGTSFLEFLHVCSSDPENDRTTAESIKAAGYSVEEYTLITKDGYILTMIRIPPNRQNSRAVMFEPGVGEDSYSWIFNGPGKGLAYLVASEGYDVWLANPRGTTHSLGHINKSITYSEYWDFSYHEIGKFDIPAQLDLIFSKISGDKISYIGHSMGTTSFFIFANERPDLIGRIEVMFGLAPVAYTGHIAGLLAITGRAVNFLSKTNFLGIDYHGESEFLPFQQNSVIKFLGKCFCYQDSFKNFCADIYMLIGGKAKKNLNETMLPVMVTHLPAGTSFKNLLHYRQGFTYKTFRYYSYGQSGNFKRYNSSVPPSYDLSKTTVPVALYFGTSDILADTIDVMHLHRELPNVIEYHLLQEYNHFDFLWGKHVFTEVYPRILKLMKNYN